MRKRLAVNAFACLLFALGVFALRHVTDTQAGSSPEQVILHFVSFASEDREACVTQGLHGRYDNAFDIRKKACAAGAQLEHRIDYRSVGTCTDCRVNGRHKTLVGFTDFRGLDSNGCTISVLNTVQYKFPVATATYRFLHVRDTTDSPTSFNIHAGAAPEQTTRFLGRTIHDGPSGCPGFQDITFTKMSKGVSVSTKRAGTTIPFSTFPTFGTT